MTWICLLCDLANEHWRNKCKNCGYRPGEHR